jgi:hypothetical protein
MVFVNNSVFDLHFMKVSTENDNNLGYKKITIMVDNMPLIEVTTWTGLTQCTMSGIFVVIEKYLWSMGLI